jgi:hypothetical protein
MKAPFYHEEIEVKQKFLEAARQMHSSEEFEKNLAAAMLYANLSEYLSYHLLESLKQTIFSGSKAFWNGIIYHDSRGTSETLTIGQIARELEKYGFPSKELIVPLLKQIAKKRNKIMHNMLRLPSNELNQIDEAIANLVIDTEELVGLIDDVYRGMPPGNITQGSDKQDKVVVEGVKDEQGKVTVKEK